MATPDSSAVRAARTAAWVVLGLGWLVPLAASKLASKGAPQVVNAFRWTAGIWLVLGLFYGAVVATRIRRGLTDRGN